MKNIKFTSVTILLTLLKIWLYAIMILYLIANIHIRDRSIKDNIITFINNYGEILLKISLFYILFIITIQYSSNDYSIINQWNGGFILPKLNNIWNHLKGSVKYKTISKGSRDEVGGWNDNRDLDNVTPYQPKSTELNNRPSDIINESLFNNDNLPISNVTPKKPILPVKENISPESPESTEQLFLEELADFKKQKEANLSDPFKVENLECPIDNESLNYDPSIFDGNVSTNVFKFIKKTEVATEKIKNWLRNITNDYIEPSNAGKYSLWKDLPGESGEEDSIFEKDLPEIPMSEWTDEWDDTKSITSSSEYFSAKSKNSESNIAELGILFLMIPYKNKWISIKDYIKNKSVIPSLFIPQLFKNIWNKLIFGRVIIKRIILSLSLRIIFGYIMTWINPWLGFLAVIDFSVLIALLPSGLGRLLLNSSVIRLDDNSSTSSSTVINNKSNTSSTTLINDKKLPHRPISKVLPQLPIDRFGNVTNRPPSFQSYNSFGLQEQLDRSRKMVNTRSAMIEDNMRKDGTTFVSGKYPGQTLNYSEKRVRGFLKKGYTNTEIFLDDTKKIYSGVPHETVNATSLPEPKFSSLKETFAERKIRIMAEIEKDRPRRDKIVTKQAIKNIKNMREFIHEEHHKSKWFESPFEKCRRIIKKIFKI